MSSARTRSFLTGATGYIGSAVLDALLRYGHDVTALVRHPEKAERVTQRGAKAIVGDLSRPVSYEAVAESCETIVHTAFDRTKQGSEVDRRAIDTLAGVGNRRADAGLPAAFVYTSGI